MFSPEGTGPAWGIKYESDGIGWVKVSFVVNGDMLNAYGTAHSGMLFALADTAFAYACNSRNDTTVAPQDSISFLSPAHLSEKLAYRDSARGR